MTPYEVYRSALEFLESIAELPPRTQMKMMRSYLKQLSQPEPMDEPPPEFYDSVDYPDEAFA